MALHKPSGRWQLGLYLSLVTAVFWGVLPLALQLVLVSLDAMTLVWFRFLVAAIFVAALLGHRKALPRLGGRSGRSYTLIAVTVVGLLLNYVFFTLGLHWTTPETAQVLIQLSPVMFLVGSVVIFGERLSRLQTAGIFIVLTGFGLFFHHKFGDMLQLNSRYAAGIGLLLFAGVAWAAYALAQKQLLTEMPSASIMLIIYIGGALFTTPAIRPDTFAGLSGLGIGLLIFTAANTIIAYGAFAEALQHWEASRVSAVLSLTPIITIITVQTAHHFWPDTIPFEELPAWSYAGAGLVVAGSMMTSLGRGRRVNAVAVQLAESPT
jgi:drug/metabolite transporter (DMT)-like permease